MTDGDELGARRRARAGERAREWANARARARSRGENTAAAEIEQATGMLMQHYGWDAGDAARALHDHATAHGTDDLDVALGVVTRRIRLPF